MSGTIVVITGPTCAGKSTLEALLAKEQGFRRVISYTTRPARPDEKHGEDYWFITDDAFESYVAHDYFAEHAEFGGYRYGTDRADYMAGTGVNPLVVLEPEGRDNILAFANEIGMPVLPVFLTNPGNVRAARFIERAYSTFVLAGGQTGRLAEIIMTNTNRLDAMLTEEIHWGPTNHPNSITFSKFDATNEMAVVTKIVSIANALGS